jgi:hypothetical protein
LRFDMNYNGATTQIAYFDGNEKSLHLPGTAWGVVVTGGGGLFNSAGTSGMAVNDTGPTMYGGSSGQVVSSGSNSVSLGINGNFWKKVVSTQYWGAQTDNTNSGAITIDPTASENYRLVANGNISSITITNAASNPQTLWLYLKQDGAGTSTWPTTIAHCVLTGGAFTKTAAANAVDMIQVRWFNTAGVWVEVSRALDVK